MVLWPALTVFAHHVQSVSSKFQTWAEGEAAGSPLRPGCAPSILGEAVIAHDLAAAHYCALQTQPHIHRSHPDLSCWCSPSSAWKSLGTASMKVLCTDLSVLAGGIPHHLSCSSPSLSGCKLWASADVSRARGARPLTMKTPHKHLCHRAEVGQPFSGSWQTLSGFSKW